jgi:hypothetical protein
MTCAKTVIQRFVALIVFGTSINGLYPGEKGDEKIRYRLRRLGGNSGAPDVIR